MKRLTALSDQLDALRLKVDIMIIGTQKCRALLKDDPNHHLVPCACGRMLKRRDVCPICATERLRSEML